MIATFAPDQFNVLLDKSAHLSLVGFSVPKHVKKSPRHSFSFNPTNPVAGEALKRHLSDDDNGDQDTNHVSRCGG